MLANSSLNDESFKASQKNAIELYQAITDSLQPWAEKSSAIADQTIKGLVQAYKETVGDPNDPEFRQRIKRDIASDQARRRMARPETDEQRVDRLLRESARSRETAQSRRASRPRKRR